MATSLQMKLQVQFTSKQILYYVMLRHKRKYYGVAAAVEALPNECNL